MWQFSSNDWPFVLHLHKVRCLHRSSGNIIWLIMFWKPSKRSELQVPWLSMSTSYKSSVQSQVYQVSFFQITVELGIWGVGDDRKWKKNCLSSPGWKGDHFRILSMFPFLELHLTPSSKTLCSSKSWATGSFCGCLADFSPYSTLWAHGQQFLTSAISTVFPLLPTFRNVLTYSTEMKDMTETRMPGFATCWNMWLASCLMTPQFYFLTCKQEMVMGCYR